jgi:hypothetical protein
MHHWMPLLSLLVYLASFVVPYQGAFIGVAAPEPIPGGARPPTSL